LSYASVTGNTNIIICKHQPFFMNHLRKILQG